jgi:hypothetical protein
MTRTYPIIKMTIAGTEYIWQDTDIVTARAIQEVHPISLELPASTITFSVYTTDARFSIFSDGELYNALAEGQVIQLYEYVNGINVFINEFYLKEWKYVATNVLSFTGMDLIGKLDGMQYDGGFWSNLTDIETILGAILDPLGILYTVSSPTAGVELKGWIPPGTAREALQQVCFAGRAMASSTINGMLLIEPAIAYLESAAIDLTVTDTDKQDDQTVELLPVVTGVELISHDYSQGATSETIFSETLEPGSYKVVYNKPYHTVEATGVGYIDSYLITEGEDFLTTEGGDFLVANGEYEYGPNSIILTVFPPGGVVTITGYPWIDSKQALFQPVALDYRSNNLIIEDATLVNITNRYPVIYRVADYYHRRYDHRFTLLNYNAPSALYGFAPVYGTGTYSAAGLKVGDTVKSNALNKAVFGIAERLEYDLTGGFRIRVKSVGIEAGPVV